MDEPWWLDGAPATVREAYTWARAGDPTAMVRIGGTAAGLGDVDDGLRWFAAAGAGDPGGPLVRSLSAVREVDRAGGQPSAWRWHPRSAGSRVWVWPGVLGENVAGGEDLFEPAFLVVTAQVEDAIHAVLRAGALMMRVTEDGALLAGHEDPDDDVYTPNSDSLYVTRAGPAIAVDTKGFAGPEMGRTMARLLAEELEWSAVAAFVCRRPDDLDSELFVPPFDWRSTMLPHDTAARVVVVRRITDTEDGGRRPLYRRHDGTWTPERASAQAFTDDSLDDVVALWPSLEHLPDAGPVSLPVEDPGHWPVAERQ